MVEHAFSELRRVSLGGFLPERDRDQFLDELTRTLLGAAELDNCSPVSQLLVEWRATAEIHADPKLARRLSAPLEAQGDAVPPRHADGECRGEGIASPRRRAPGDGTSAWRPVTPPRSTMAPGSSG